MVYIGKIGSAKTLRVSMVSRVGKTAPTYCTAWERRFSLTSRPIGWMRYSVANRWFGRPRGPSPERRT